MAPLLAEAEGLGDAAVAAPAVLVAVPPPFRVVSSGVLPAVRAPSAADLAALADGRPDEDDPDDDDPDDEDSDDEDSDEDRAEEESDEEDSDEDPCDDAGPVVAPGEGPADREPAPLPPPLPPPPSSWYSTPPPDASRGLVLPVLPSASPVSVVR